MRLRQLVLACGFASFVLSQYASALGLGEVTVRSALNQPLEAEIKLLDTRDLTAEQIIVTLASPADFERNGVDRLYFYTEFEFEVVLDSTDGSKVLVTSKNPVREPYLNFLVEARWTAGRLLREYTLLMDLPTFADDARPAPVQAATRAPQQTEATQPQKIQRRVEEPTPAVTEPSSATTSTPVSETVDESYADPQPKPTPSPSRASTITGDEYTIQARDTLWNIARDVSGRSDASLHQAMMALYEANPDAFINGNINMLRRGQILRIPSNDEMTSRSRSEAVSQFAAKTGDTSLGAQLNASRRSSSGQSGSSEVAGRVKLAAPGSGSDSGGQGSGANEGSGSGLETELAATLEELDKSKSENTELTSRVRDLEAQIDTMERLVAVSNEKLRAMQLGAQQAASATAVSSAGSYAVASVDSYAVASEESYAAASKDSYATDEVPEISPEDLADLPGAKRRPREDVLAGADTTVSSEASSEASSSAASSKPKVIVPPPPPPPPSTMDTLIANAKWIGLGILLLGGIGGYFAYRRRTHQETNTESFDEDMFSMDAQVENETSYEEEDVLADLQEDDIDLGSPEEEMPVEAETGDVVAEAEIYIAYGQLDKAEELLLNGLKKDPHSADIRLKLLEVYSHLEDSSSFDKHYAALAGVAGAAALARAAELRAAIPGMGEVNLPHAKIAPAQADTSNSGLGDFSFDDLQLDDEPVTQSASADLSLDLADDDLSFDLDSNDDIALDDAADTSLQSSTDSDWELPGTDDDNLDFEVDLGDDISVSEVAEQDDLSELSLALDDMDADSIEDELEVGESSIEEEFNFDFTPAPVAPSSKAKSSLSSDDDLDVADDDFNLDMDGSGIDLAALDHEMEALDDMGDLDDALHVPSSGLNLTTDLDIGGGKFESDADEDFVLKDDDVTAEDHEDDVFAEALSDFNKGGTNLDLSKFDADNFEVSDEDMDAELDFLADADEAATKLDLARAYIDMGDTEGAKDILSEVVSEGNDEQRNEAKQLLKRIDS